MYYFLYFDLDLFLFLEICIIRESGAIILAFCFILVFEKLRFSFGGKVVKFFGIENGFLRYFWDFVFNICMVV